MIVVLADDFSGAAEMAGIASRWFDEVELATRFPQETSADVLVIDTDTRLKSDEEATDTLNVVCGKIKVAGVTQVFKKIDSVLRGPVRVEIEASLTALGRERTVLAPANPSRNRVIRNGKYFCNGLLLHESEFAHDPTHPAETSDVKAIVGVLPSVWIPDVDSAECWKSVIDQLEPDDLPVGAADFFTAWLARFAGNKKHDYSDGNANDPGNHLWLCGSLTTWTQRSDDFSRHGIPCATAPAAVFEGKDGAKEWADSAIEHFESNRYVAVAFGASRPASSVDSGTLLTAIAETAYQIRATVGVERMFLEGGATARAVVDRFGGTSWGVVREWAPGVVEVGPAESVKGQLCRFVVKPGSYTWPESAWPETCSKNSP